jgi:hypothetical protein
MHFYGHLVAHGTGGTVKCGFFAEKGGNFLLKQVNTGIFTKNVITHFRMHHGVQHFRCGAGKSVGAEFDSHGTMIRRRSAVGLKGEGSYDENN